MKNASNVCITFITKPTCSNESIKVEAPPLFPIAFVPQSSLNKQQSQQMRDINRGTRRLEARHKNQRTSSRRRGVRQKCFIVPKWQFFIVVGS